MNTNPSSGEERPSYAPPRMTSYTESQVAETLGPVLLSGNGSDLGVLAGGDQSPTSNNTGGRPRR